MSQQVFQFKPHYLEVVYTQKKHIYTYIKSGCERINCQALEKESIKAEPLENWNWQRKSTEIQELQMLLVLLGVCLPFSGSWPGRANVRCGTHRWNKWKMIYRYLSTWRIFMDFLQIVDFHGFSTDRGFSWIFHICLSGTAGASSPESLCLAWSMAPSGR